MITVYDEVKNHCQRNNIQFTKKDTAIIGKIVGFNFKNEWAKLLVKPAAGVEVPGGFVYIQEPERLVVVNAYPDVLIDKIRSLIIDYFVKAVVLTKQESTDGKKKRKRIPFGKINYKSKNK